jgi:glycosyltransferase involved in cell wall biosynthesis
MKISIITVSYNSATTIGDTLRSVAGQIYRNYEHIVVDGASTDNTLQIVSQVGGPGVRVVSEPDKGIYDAMNKGLELARGEVVGFLNSDDFYPRPDVLERVYQAFKDLGVDAVYGDLCYVRRDDPTAIVRYWRSSPFTPGLFAKAWCPPHPTLFVRRSTYQRLGGYDLRFTIAADMELMARFLEVHQVAAHHIDEVLVHMRVGGTTNRSLKNILQQNREIWEALGQHGLERSLPVFVLSKLMARFHQFISRPAT